MEIKTVPPLLALTARQETTIPEVGAWAEHYCSRLLAEAETGKLTIAGPWVFVSRDLPADVSTPYVATFCLPVTGGAAAGKLPAFACASLTFHGRLERLFIDGYQPLLRAVTAAGIRTTGESREVYHRWVGPTSDDNVIEIQFGIAD